MIPDASCTYTHIHMYTQTSIVDQPCTCTRLHVCLINCRHASLAEMSVEQFMESGLLSTSSEEEEEEPVKRKKRR